MSSPGARLEAEAAKTLGALKVMQEQICKGGAKRSDEMQRAEMSIDGIETRLRGLEMKRSDENSDGGKGDKTAAKSAGWTPNHLILCGWQPSTPRRTIQREAHEWLARQDPEV